MPDGKTTVGVGKQIAIPPGQLALLITEEEVAIPTNRIGFISIKFTAKMRGLINVSGFHVDPGFKGKLKFSVLTQVVGTQSLILEGIVHFVDEQFCSGRKGAI